MTVESTYVPVVNFITPTNNYNKRFVNVTTINFTGDASVTAPTIISTVEFSVNNSTWQTASGTTSWNVNNIPLAAGIDNYFYARSIANNGKTNSGNN